MGHLDSIVTLIGVAPGEVYDLLMQGAPSGQDERNFPADWHQLGLIDGDDDWPMDRWIGL